MVSSLNHASENPHSAPHMTEEGFFVWELTPDDIRHLYARKPIAADIRVMEEELRILWEEKLLSTKEVAQIWGLREIILSPEDWLRGNR